MQMRRELERQAEASLPRESFGELLSQLANNSAGLVRDEIQLARQEMKEKLSTLRGGIIIAASGLVLVLLALFTLTAAAVIGLANYLGAGKSALIIGGALAIIGGVTAFVGIGRIKQTSLKPEETIETLEEDREWLKELT
jgi:uncharacterized membrane protein YqjE